MCRAAPLRRASAQTWNRVSESASAARRGRDWTDEFVSREESKVMSNSERSNSERLYRGLRSIVLNFAGKRRGGGRLPQVGAEIEMPIADQVWSDY